MKKITLSYTQNFMLLLLANLQLKNQTYYPFSTRKGQKTLKLKEIETCECLKFLELKQLVH